MVVSLTPEDILGAPRGVEVVEVSPRSLRLQVEAIVRREVQVLPRIEGTPGPGFAVRQVRPEPRSVQIAGPRSEVTRVHQVYTMPVSVEGRTATFATRAGLEPIGQQVQFVNEGSIQMSIDIGPRKAGEGREPLGHGSAVAGAAGGAGAAWGPHVAAARGA